MQEFLGINPEWKLIIGTISVMILGISLLLVHKNLVLLPDAILFGAGAMWISGGVLSLYWIIMITRRKRQSDLERWG
ncbi:MAG: hypothetical protein YK1309IOTA_10002 [Marine Group I thaumarchaeote]|nr:MAG: hypothetical protein YK1309IOTA_10002 [Marine Group I thaumarchaeote]